MKNSLYFIVLLSLLSGTIAAQKEGYVFTCDTVYTSYKNNKEQVAKIIKEISDNSIFSLERKNALVATIQKENYQRLEYILYDVIHKDWCKERVKVAKELIKLDIPSLNSWILKKATSNRVKMDISGITSICYSGKEQFSPREAEADFFQDEKPVRLAHNGLLISQLSGEKIIDKIAVLRNDENVFARYTFAEILFYFEVYTEIAPILTSILKEEIQGLENSPKHTTHDLYAAKSLGLLKKVDKRKARRYYKKMKKLYQTSVPYSEDEYPTLEEQMRRTKLEHGSSALKRNYKQKKCLK